ncbi:multidrug resistance-associated protein 4-like isoform X2 [Actinia tenebrosa]|nr:multidrug resistance-associated protein 4-like isoform X2 [Actinia tenebrosa]
MGLRRKASQWVDRRVKAMNEIISGMSVIKMYTWELPFAEKVDSIRRNELSWFLKLASIRGIFMAFFFSSAALISYVTFLTYVLTGNILTAQKVFTSMALYNSVRINMTLFFPIGITLMNEGRVSIERIQKLLSMDELHSHGLITTKLRPKPEQCGVVTEEIKASWNEEISRPTLNNISFKISQGELLAVVGSVGAGKSSLLMAILGELPLIEGTINVKGKIAYSSQQAWIYNGSLRNNIIFGNDYDESRYNEVIKVCALERDIELLSEGDMTLVGERGVSLSGGQRARVNLARAVYCDADIYLLDDPLSAVDANVGRHLFDKCVCGYLAQKPRILVTHQTQFLKDADVLIALSEGECIAKGSYQDLCRAGIDFMTLCAEEDEDKDSAIEDSVEDINARPEFKRQFSRRLNLSRQFSRQDSIPPTDKVEVVRGSSCHLSHRLSQRLESTLSVTSAATEVSVYDEDLVPKEMKQEGAVTMQTYLRYFKSLHSLGAAICIFILFLITQAMYMLSDWWLSKWCNEEEQYFIKSQAYSTSNSTSIPPPTPLDRHLYLGIYSFLAIGLIVFSMLRTQLFYRITISGSRILHFNMFSSLMRAPSYFFDTNSIGRILNRFSKDMGFIDDMMPFVVCDFSQTSMMVLGILLLVAVNNPITFVVVIPIVCLFWYLRQYYMKTSREVKRIEGVSRSPVFGHFSTTLLGLDTIRAFSVEQTFTDQMNFYQDEHTRAWMTFISSSAWLGYRLDVLCVIFICFVALVSPALKDALSAGVVGLTLSYAIMISGVFQQCVKQSAEVENMMTSVERVLEYTDLEPEAEPETDVKPPKGWPDKGGIKFDNMSFSYHRSMPKVLHNISCCIKPREKIGVVGRTGAGKSSLLSTLFRLAEPIGLIEVDDMNIRELGLRDLRSKISIIPQDPVIFGGTMRKNINPFNEYNDNDLWNVLEEVQLKAAVEALPGKLEAEIAEGGSNFSVGQRQLICLARAILRHNKILVIDEATANVDPRTDALIQTTIREKFKKCTVLTIAHRLHTIMDSDRVIVLDAGHLKEFDAPYILLKDGKSIFSQLVTHTGPDEARKLYEVAREAYYEKKAISEDQEPDEPDGITSLSEGESPEVVIIDHLANGEAGKSLQFESNL